MPLVDNAWYVNFGDGSTTGYYAVTKWATGAVKAAGALIRQLTTPAVGSERVFVCTTAGTTNATTEPTWVVTRGALQPSDNGVIWQECTGIAGINGDLTNTPNWTTVKNTAIVLGQVIQRNSGASYQICTVAGTAGNGAEPGFSNTAGTTTVDNGATWTSLGAVGNFTGWQAPHARLANALAANWGSNGPTIFLASNSAETQATNISLSAGAEATVVSTYSVDQTAAVPPGSANLLAGASITTTGNSAITVGVSGSYSMYLYGITFNTGSGANSPNFSVASSQTTTGVYYFDNCAIALLGTSGGQILFGASSGGGDKIRLNNTTLKVSNTGSGIAPNVNDIVWRNTASAIAGATLPTTLISGSSNVGSVFQLVGVDLSALGAGKTLMAAFNVGGYRVQFIDCKLGASVTVAAAPVRHGCSAEVIRSDSTGTNYRQERYIYEGTLTTETTVIRTGGAGDGITSLSWKLVTTANSKFASPLESFPIAIWNAKTGQAATVILAGIINAAAVPNNDDIWIEIEYLGSGGSPLGSFINSTKANGLATGSALTADTSAWDSVAAARQNSFTYSTGNVIKVASNPGRIFFCTAGGASAGSEPAGYASAVDGGSVTDNAATFRAGSRFQMSVVLTVPQPQLPGYIYTIIKAAKASTTWWVDPLIQLS